MIDSQKSKRKGIILFIILVTIFVFTILEQSAEAATNVEPKQITINYKIDLSKSATGLDEKQFIYDETVIPTVGGNSTYSVIVNYSESVKIENISTNVVTPYDSYENNGTTKDMSILQFTGWKESKNSTIIDAGKTLTWKELTNYAENGVITLNTTWYLAKNYEHANFFINYKSEALDSGDNVETQDTNAFTLSLWVSYVGNAESNKTSITDSTADNSYKANSNIRALEGNKNNGERYIEEIPSDEYIFSQLKNYASKLSIDGESISVDDLDTEHFEVRWYVFKLQSDCWHIDGKLVRREGKMVINKTFIGPKEAIETAVSTEQNYHFTIEGGDTISTIYLSDATNFVDNSIEDNYVLNYSWIIDVKYGINYTITENNYLVLHYTTDTIYNIQDPDNKQNKESTSSDRATVIGINNYAIDSSETLDINKIININFTNTYSLMLSSKLEMPRTGGSGVNHYYIIGILLMTSSLIIIYLRKNRERKVK